jgi:hypothetical protein
MYTYRSILLGRLFVVSFFYKRWINGSGGGVFVAEAVDMIWPFAVVRKLMTEFCFGFSCFKANTGETGAHICYFQFITLTRCN